MSKTEKGNNGNVCFDTHEKLYEGLQSALGVELFTIPPYLCALWSLEDGHNPEAHDVIRSVVMEEMLHMTLVANLMNSIRDPKFDPIKVYSDEMVVRYPKILPHSNPDDHHPINLEKFSMGAIDAFMEIEYPRKPGGTVKCDDFDTIGQFYEAIADGFKYVARTKKLEEKLFIGKEEDQVLPKHYYGSGGFVFSVWSLEYALKAIHEISEQGEGYVPEVEKSKAGQVLTAVHARSPGSIWDGDDHFGQIPQPAHYYRFQEIKMGQKYQMGDTAFDPDDPLSGPTGEKFEVDWGKVYNMQKNPSAKSYDEGTPIRQKMDAFNQHYKLMLETIEKAFNGEPHLLQDAVGEMYKLKYLGKELMRIPSGDGVTTVGPSFEYYPYQ